MAHEFELDYSKLGFRCGLEIHQQIGLHKLFCKCPSIKVEDPVDYCIKRYLRSSAGELGKIDVAAKFEVEKKKYFLYEGHNANTCIIELDECPPNPINEDLLDAAIEISLLLNAKIVDEVQVMRKTVVDGSNTAGFQRTALVGYDGCIDTSFGKVRISNICLEEEAAQKLEETKDYVKYKLDRLGIGLIEVGTEADIKTAEHAREVAFIIGDTLRSTDKIKRGIGTIRQDVNISIKGHPRVEIKGFQDLRSIPKTIDNEIKRQLKDKGKKIEAHVRKAESDLSTIFLRPMPGADRLYPETDCSSVKITKERIERINEQKPELLYKQVEEFEKKYKVGQDQGRILLHNKIFVNYVNKFKNITPWLIAQVLIEFPKEIKKRFNLDSSKLKIEDFEETLTYLDEGKINKETVIELLAKKLKNEKVDLTNYESVSDKDLESEIKEIIKQKPGLNIGAYMGIVMGKHRGKVEGRKVMEILRKVVK